MKQHIKFRYLSVLVTTLFCFSLSAQVTLPSGKVVPKNKFIVYIMIGHSNMVGRTSEMDTSADPRAWNFFITDCCQSMPNHEWAPARDCIHKDFGGSGGGPTMLFLKKMVKRNPDYYFGVVQNARSGMQCRANYFKNNGAGVSDLYSEMITALDLIKNKVTFGGIICMLGVVEAVGGHDSAVCKSFSNDIDTMVRNFRDTLGIPDLPFLLGEFERDAPRVPIDGKGFWEIVDSQTNCVPKKVPFSDLIPSDSLEYFDRWHYTWKSYDTWTDRAITLIERHGWFPLGSTSVKPLSATTFSFFKSDILPSVFFDALGRSTLYKAPCEGRGIRSILLIKNNKLLSGR
jgi:hypothetical protein